MDALRSALAIGLAPLLLDSLMAAAELLDAAGEGTAATQVAAIVQEHPAASAATRARAQRMGVAPHAASTIDTPEIVLETGADNGLVTLAEQLLAAFAPRLKAREHATLPEGAPLVESLSDRELQVLRRAAAGMSNRQISRELYLSVSTVKSHLHHINQKLAVQTRTQAIARARELHYL